MKLTIYSGVFLISCCSFIKSQEDSSFIDFTRVQDRNLKCNGRSITDLREKFFKFSDSLCTVRQSDGRSTIGLCCDNNDPIDKTRKKPTQSDDYDGSESQQRGCGVSSAKFSKIAGGVETDAKEYPWMVALITRKNASSPFCGGTLITDRHILTAAHCANRIKVQDLWIRLGEYSFETAWETRAKSFRASEIRIHSDFNTATYENDIALVKMLKPATFNTYVWPVCLPSMNDDAFEGKSARVIGYGAQFFGGPASPVLMEVSVPIWKNSDCQQKYLHRISDDVMCAGAANADSCQGDSGGPLLMQLPNDRWIIVGITSWGIRCGDPRYPGIYTRVNRYLEWIIENAEF